MSDGVLVVRGLVLDELFGGTLLLLTYATLIGWAYPGVVHATLPTPVYRQASNRTPCMVYVVGVWYAFCLVGFRDAVLWYSM